MTPEALADLHWEQERLFSTEIMRHGPGSRGRRRATREGYGVVTSILAVARSGGAGAPRMGFSNRDRDLLHKVLRRSRRSGALPTLFEVGFGFGDLLHSLQVEGYAIGGNEVADTCFDTARARLGEAAELLRGSLPDLDLSDQEGRWDVVYWNDVMEHIPPDEIEAHLRVIRALLPTGGTMVTVTPNWHVRPSDVTRRHRPPRSEPEGFHLREYTVRETRRLLARAGFGAFSMPLLVLPDRAWMRGRGAIRTKLALEPVLECLPIRLARLAAGGFGYHCLIARAR